MHEIGRISPIKDTPPPATIYRTQEAYDSLLYLGSAFSPTAMRWHDVSTPLPDPLLLLPYDLPRHSPHEHDEGKGERPRNLKKRGVHSAQTGVIGKHRQAEQNRSQTLP